MATVNTEFLRHSLSNDNNNNSEQVAQRDFNFVLGILGIVCFPIVLTILILVIFVYKAYKTTFQRLILYYIIIGLFCELTYALRIRLIFECQLRICEAVIYLYQYFLLAWYAYVTAVTNCSFLFTLYLIRGSSNIRHGGKLVECICVLLAIVAPMMYIWMPVCDGNYEVLNCRSEPSGWHEDVIVFNILALLMSADIVLVCIALCCTFCFIRKRIQNKRTIVLLKNLLYHVGMNAIVMGLLILFTVYYTHSSKSLSDTVSIVGAVGFPLVLFLSQLFLSVKSRSGEGFKCCCKVNHRQHHYLDTDRNMNLTNPTSHPINQPSHTYFSVPYTGAFTQVTSNEHIESEGEERPLIIRHH